MDILMLFSNIILTNNTSLSLFNILPSFKLSQSIFSWLCLREDKETFKENDGH